MGIAHAQAAVSINDATNVECRGEYLRKELAWNNSTGAVWQGVTVRAVLSGTTNTASGAVFLPRTPEVFGYDLDGNQTNDGRWVYTWDAENRLVGVESTAGLPEGARGKTAFVYDDQGRRIAVAQWHWSGGAWVQSGDTRFLYDGWNPVVTANSQLAPQQVFLWGLDLSGSLQGAGGVGGLLAIKDTSQGVHFVAYDGNGNVSALVNAANGNVSAKYDYAPFGETLRMTGPMAYANKFRFSTKYQDEPTGYYYYGFRYYNPSTGRWLSRDPVGERGGKNLYAHCRNNPISRIDKLGKMSIQGMGGGATTGSGNGAAYAGVWFNFDSNDYDALGGSGTLVFNKTLDFSINPCSGNTPPPLHETHSFWIKNSFTLRPDGSFASADDLDSKNNDPNNQGISLEVGASGVMPLYYGTDYFNNLSSRDQYGLRRQLASCSATWGYYDSYIRWELMPGLISGGTSGGVHENYVGADSDTPYSASPPSSWTDSSGSVQGGYLHMRVEWKCDGTISVTALESSQPVSNGGPVRDNKREQGGGKTPW